jgi:molybdopterin-guanine dinucleotide biosynthesis protein A
VRRPLIAGVFIGGKATRMGGRAKGLLSAPDGRPIVERWVQLLRSVDAQVVLVGATDAYAHLGLERWEDDPPGIGPLGGLVALLRRAGSASALAVACDMPYVSRALVDRLVRSPAAPVVAPRRDGRWEPLFARYDAARVLPMALARVAARAHALGGLLDAAGAVELPLTAAEARELCDWDSPEDLATS